MRIIGLHNGHNANICALEDGRLTAHWELEKFFDKKNFGFDCTHQNEIAIVLTEHLLPSLGWELDSVGTFVFSSLHGMHGDWSRTEFSSIIDGRSYENSLTAPWISWHASWRGKMRRFAAVSHHVCHMAYSYYSSSFTEAVVFALDGWGDFATSTTVGVGTGNKLHYHANLTSHPLDGVSNNGIGALFFWLGRIFPFLGEELLDIAGKAMGLSSFGTPRDEWRPVVQSTLRTWPFHRSIPEKMIAELGIARSELLSPHADITVDLMATIQSEAENYVVEVCRVLERRYQSRNLVIGGGCGLNILINSAIRRRTRFTNVFVPPACSDTGNAIGAACYFWFSGIGNRRTVEKWHDPYLGEPLRGIERYVDDTDQYRVESYETADCEALISKIAELLADGRIGAVARGRAEIGPRALGHRSILAAPTGSSTANRVNNEIKRREFWRPFAPICLEARAEEWFEGCVQSPYMMFAYKVREGREASIPAVTHVDGTARVQTVNASQESWLTSLLTKFELLTGTPILLNTSLNLKGMPMTNDACAAVELFCGSTLDFLQLENHLLLKR